jgi:surfeit locus 1 family protein
MNGSREPSSPSARPRTRRWVFFGLAVAVGLACIRLGIWQLDRLAERRAVNQSIRDKLELPPLSLPADLGAGSALNFRQAVVHGEYDPAHEVYLTSRSREGIAGLHVVTPLLLKEGGPSVLVDRGWISDTDFRARSAESWAEEGPVEATGLLLPSQPEPAIPFLADRIPAEGGAALTEWRALSIDGLRRQMPYPILDVYLAQEGEPGTPAAPIPSPEFELDEGPHLGYAIQWFAFAAIALIGGAVWLRRGASARP